ncbi:hypothetical protein [Hydrogenophaga sp.]|uniref:hypothetical protein n=1 Tax=Hydrogenophaga sp. TaxID=1904254 RepID=UPI0035AF2F14
MTQFLAISQLLSKIFAATSFEAAFTLCRTPHWHSVVCAEVISEALQYTPAFEPLSTTWQIFQHSSGRTIRSTGKAVEVRA